MIPSPTSPTTPLKQSCPPVESMVRAMKEQSRGWVGLIVGEMQCVTPRTEWRDLDFQCTASSEDASDVGWRCEWVDGVDALAV